MDSIDSARWPSSLGIVSSARRRLTALALSVVVVLTATGRAWSALAPTRQDALACCRGPCPDAPGGVQTRSGPCGSLGLLGCGSQPVSATAPDRLDAPPSVFALTSSVTGPLLSPLHFSALASMFEGVAPPLVSHTILRL